MKKTSFPVFLMLILAVLGCALFMKEYRHMHNSPHQGNAAPVKGNGGGEQESGPVTPVPVFGKSFRGIVTETDPQEKQLTFQELDGEKTASFFYDGTTSFFNRFGQSVTAVELSIGEIADVRYDDTEKPLISVSESTEAFTITDVVKFDIDEKKHMITIAGETYRFTDDIFLWSEGEKTEWMNINNLDTLTVRGIGKQVSSVVVTAGHGYIRLLNDSYFLGGWIEVGQELIKPVTEDMLMTVPEGSFHVRLTNKGYLGEKDVTIERNKESVIDLSDIPIEEVAVGHVEFKIEPGYAQLFIDGDITDYEERVPLEYGVHNIRIEAAGYQSVSTNIKVGSEYAQVDIELDPDDGTAQKNGSSETPFTQATNAPTQAPTPLPTSVPLPTVIPTPLPTQTPSGVIDIGGSSSSTEIISSIKKIYVEQPAGAEVYLDGSYIGIAPVSTPKVTGSHVITLSKSGFVTRSYTVNIENDGNDITLSFSALSAEQ